LCRHVVECTLVIKTALGEGLITLAIMTSVTTGHGTSGTDSGVFKRRDSDDDTVDGGGNGNGSAVSIMAAAAGLFTVLSLFANSY
jgi:hypothetical protein